MLDVGMSTGLSLKVRLGDTAEALCISFEDSFPRVFATSRMIALMEVAAARLLRPLLEEGQVSVGVGVDVQHTAATAIGARVRVIATLQGFDGKFFRFKVEAFDEAGIVGAGRHTRAIVAAQRLLSGAARRNPAVSFERATSARIEKNNLESLT